MNDKPMLRMIEAIPVRSQEEVVVVLRDHEELSGNGPLAVPMPLFMIMTLFDGTRDLREVQAEINRQFQQIIPVEQIQQIVGELDNFYLLDNDRSAERRAELIREYEANPSRPAAHAGVAYPEDPAELVQVFDAFFQHPTGPGARPAPAKAPRGLVAPHMDLRSGGPCMAWAYNEFRGAEPPTLYIILGVAHQPTENLFTLSEKDFETPLGPAPVNKAAAARLKELYGADRLAGEYAHKHEHSVEFQAVFLKYIHRAGPDFTILPILCGSIEGALEDETPRPPRDEPEVGEFVAALATLIEEFGPRVCVIAGVDLSHVGKKFGHEQGVDELRAGLVRAADMRMLERVAARDPEGFFNHFREDGNARNVDAVTAVYTMLHAIGAGEGEILNYDQYRERETESLVSFASVALR